METNTTTGSQMPTSTPIDIPIKNDESQMGSPSSPGSPKLLHFTKDRPSIKERRLPSPRRHSMISLPTFTITDPFDIEQLNKALQLEREQK